MRLHRKLIHKLLRYAEEKADGIKLAAPEFEDYSETQVHYHIGLCEEAGFLHVLPIPSGRPGSSPRKFHILNLTWKGHLELEEKKYACQD